MFESPIKMGPAVSEITWNTQTFFIYAIYKYFQLVIKSCYFDITMDTILFICIDLNLIGYYLLTEQKKTNQEIFEDQDVVVSKLQPSMKKVLEESVDEIRSLVCNFS